MGMLLRHRPNVPAEKDEFYKKAEQAFMEQEQKAKETETKEVKSQLKGRRPKK